MKHLRLPLIFLICSCLILLPSARMKVRAQDGPEQGKKVFDNYSTVVGAVYPAAGVMFKVAGEMLDTFGYFGNSVDLVGEAIKHINARLDSLEKRMTDTENQLQRLDNKLLSADNRNRIRFLKDRHQEIQDLVDEMQKKVTDNQSKRILANKAQRIAGRFLDDPDMDIWKWSDLRQRDQVMMPADFKPLPALEYYGLALVTWMAAIDSATDGDYEFVKRTYGPELKKHIAFLSVTPGWNDRADPMTLPENIMARVSCTLEPVSRQSENRKCQIAERCEDIIARVSTARTQEVTMPLDSDLCNVPPGASARGSEDELERMYGTEVMQKLAEKLAQLKDSGTVREQFVGTFDPATQTAQFLYAVKPNGDLLWYMHRVVTRKIGVPSTGTQGPSDFERARNPGTRVSQGRVTASGSVAGGASRSRVRPGTVAKSEITHFLDGPKRVGSGWENFREVIPAGLSGVYALTRDGKLLWYRHDGFLDGSVKWDGPKEVGRGWGDFKQIIPMGDGIIYAITQDGRLEWRRHVGYLTGAGLDEHGMLSPGSWEGPRNVGTGWGDFKQVFAGGEGVIYAITQEGKLLWYKHLGLTRSVSFARLKETWEGPVEVGSGWQNFKTIFSPGDGVIYVMRPTGEFIWYKHEGYKDGSVNWREPVQVAADWKDFLFVFPRMTGTYTPSVVR